MSLLPMQQRIECNQTEANDENSCFVFVSVHEELFCQSGITTHTLKMFPSSRVRQFKAIDYGQTKLHQAAYSGSYEKCQQLVENAEEDINVLDRQT